MPTFRIKGIIIKKQDVREADRIFTIFTDNLGKIQAYGRGTGKINSKLGGHLDLFSAVDLLVAAGKGMPTITYAKNLENFKNIKSNLAKAGIAFYAGELLDKFVLNDYKDTRIFKLLYYFFDTLNVSHIEELVQIRILFWSFELKLLKLLGFLPELKICIKCKEKVQNEINYFDLLSGGIICSGCKGDNQEYQIKNKTIDILNKLNNREFNVLPEMKINNHDALRVKEVIDQYVIFLLEKKLKSPEFIEKINSLERRFEI